jgi:hypothetical protein
MRIRASDNRLIRISGYCRPTAGAFFWKLEWSLITSARSEDWGNHRWNDVALSANDYSISDPQILPPYFPQIVQSCS